MHHNNIIFSIFITIKMSFIDCIKEGNLDKAKQFLQDNPNYNIHANDEEAFRWSCRLGHLKVAKWLWDISNHKINIHAKNEDAFRWSCYSGHLDIAKLLWDISDHKINIHVSNEEAFRFSCFFGHLDIGKWLWDISDNKINIHAYTDFAFRSSCERGHLEVAKCLLNLNFDYFVNWINENTINDKIKLELQNIIDAKIIENMIQSRPQINKDTIVVI
jgi:ankyrin repeat protein